MEETEKNRQIGEFSEIQYNHDSIKKLKTYPESALKDRDILKEAKIYKMIEGKKHFLELKTYQRHENGIIIEVERAGPSIEELMYFCGGRLSLKTSLMLFDQMLEAIEELHQLNVIHCNLKPNHFLIGMKRKSSILYLIDFENCVILNNLTNKNEKKYFHSDIDFLSFRQLDNQENSFFDDLESLTYILIYMLTGSLPWKESVNQVTEEEKDYSLVSYSEKRYLPSDFLCAGLPR